jgi:hypothetical protein
MPPLLRIFLGVLTAYVLVSLFYAHLEDDARDALRKDALAKAATKRQQAQEKHEQDSIAERRHNDLVSALRTERQGTATATTTDKQQAALPTDTAASRTTSPSAPAAATAGVATTAAQAKSSAKPAPASVRSSLDWLLPALALLGLALLAGFVWIGWRERQNKLLVPDRFERDTPLLELLLRAFAGPIGRVLPIPRQVKRFASKARLQHNLLHALAKNTPLAPTGASQLEPETPANEWVGIRFGPEVQVLAILVLLLLEEEIVRESRSRLDHLSNDTAPVYLRETSQEEFAAKLRGLFINWHEMGLDEAVYERFRRVAGSSVPDYEGLLVALESKGGAWLLMQLHRLNAGLLV